MADFMDDMAVSHTGVRNQWFFATLSWAECEIFFRWTSAKKDTTVDLPNQKRTPKVPVVF